MIPINLYKREKAAQLFPMLAYEPEKGVFLLDDKCLGFAFNCSPLAGFEDGTGPRLDSILNHDWPVNSIMSFTMYSTDNITTDTNNFVNARNSFNNDALMRKIIDERVEFLRENTVLKSSGQIPLRKINLVVSVRIPISGNAPTEQELDEVGELAIMIEKYLSTVGLWPKKMDQDDLYATFHDLLHHGKDSSWSTNPKRILDKNIPINEQLLDWDSEIKVHESGLTIGDTHVKTLGVKNLPEYGYHGMATSYICDVMSGARGIKNNFVLSCQIYFPSVTKTKSAIEKKRQFTTTQAYGPIVKFVPIIGLKQQSFSILNDAFDKGERPVQMNLSVSVFGSTLKEAQEGAANTRSYFNELGMKLMVDKYYTLPFFINGLPLCADYKAVSDLFRYKTMSSGQAATFVPVYGEWPGTGTPTMTFTGRGGQYMNCCLYDSGTNYNACIAAQSGAGKSFFTQYMITNYLSIGSKCWVIDVGRSYLNLCLIYGGDFIHFGQDSDICLNPFELVKNYNEEADILVGLLAAMAAPTEKLTDFQVSALKRLTAEVWSQKGNQMQIDDVEKACLAYDDPRVKDIGSQLYSFTSKGEYGKYFNGRNNVSFSNRFTVLELDDLQGREHLQQVVLLQLIYQIQQDMYMGDRDRKKICIIDEAWALLTKGDIGAFIETGYRRFRKYGGAAVTVTQSVSDLYTNRVGKAIAENSANMYLLNQKGQAIEELRKEKRLPLNDAGYDYLKTVHTVKGHYSEIFFNTEYGTGIGRLVVDPFQALLYSTTADDFQALKNRRDAGMTIHEAIEDLLRERQDAA